MGQYRPSSLIPSTLTSDYTIDATKDNVFTCKINGTSPTIKYRLKIMQNNTASTVVYDTGVVTLSTPLYPVNSDGTDNILSVTVPSTSGMVNGNEYKWTISSYWTATDFYESFDNVFKAYKEATVTIADYPNPINKKTYTFSANLTMASGVGVERFGWIIYNDETEEIPVNTIDTDNIYSSDVKVTYDGFLSKEKYKIKVRCWLSDGTMVETPFSDISVEYPIDDFESIVVAQQTLTSSVLVKWSNMYYVFGQPANNNYTFESQYPWSEAFKPVYLNLASGNSITYSTITGKAIDLPTTVSQTFGFYCENDNSNIYRADGVDKDGNPYYIQLSKEAGKLYLDVNGTKSTIYTLLDNDKWFVLSIDNGVIRIIKSFGNFDGLYPSETLYPSDNLFPRDNTYGTGLAGYVQTNIITDGTWHSFKFSGKALLKFFWVRALPLSTDTWNALVDFNYIPEWDMETRILATFQNNLSAGNAFASSDIVGWLVYRRESDSAVLKFVRMNTPDRDFVVDYAVKNMVGVEYWVFPSFETEIGTPNVSNRVVPNWWSWDLIVADRYDDDKYYVSEVHRFDLNVTSGQLSNNTTVSVLNNFTPYSKIQHSNTNYWTGQITTLLGNCADEYVDTIEQMESIKALTTDGKDKFLKDRKGNIWKIRLSSPVVENMQDEYIEQAVTIQLDWMEVGSAEFSSVTEPLDTTLEDVFVKPGSDKPNGPYSLQEKSIIPAKIQQNVSPDRGFYGLSSVKVEAIPLIYQDVSMVTAVPDEVLDGDVFVTAAGRVETGTMPNIGAVVETLDISHQIYNVPEGYHNGNGAVRIIPEEKTTTPTEYTQTITPSDGKVLSSVEVNPIPDNYANVDNADVVASDIMSGKVAYGKDQDGNAVEITGVMPIITPSAKVLDMSDGNQSFTIPEGYHDGTGTVEIVPETVSITPTKQAQTVSPTSGKIISEVNVGAIPDAYQDITGVTAVADDVLSGKVIIGADGSEITGSMPIITSATNTIDTVTTEYTIPLGYHDGTGKVNLINEEKTATPATVAQEITPSAGKVLSKVTISAISSDMHDTSGVTATAGDVLSGKKIVDATGATVTGSMPNRGAVSGSIIGLTDANKTYTIPAGYHNGSGTVTLTSDIENALAAI